MILSTLYNDLKQLTPLEKRFMWLLLLSGCGALVLTSLGALTHFGKPTSLISLLYYWGGLLITTPILYCALFPALRSWFHQATQARTLDIPIYVCLLLGYGYSLYVTFCANNDKRAFLMSF